MLKYDGHVISCVEGKDMIKEPSFRPFSLGDLLKAFKIWVAMCYFCLMLFLFEMVYYRCSSKVNQPKKRAKATKKVPTRPKSQQLKAKNPNQISTRKRNPSGSGPSTSNISTALKTNQLLVPVVVHT